MKGQPGTEQDRGPQAQGVSGEQARGMSQGRLGVLAGSLVRGLAKGSQQRISFK